jgi:sec-independent protein translocase protein TatC
MGISFETPLVLFIISLLGFVTAGPLLRNWRIAVVISAVAAALITPTVDPVNMGLVMGPLLVLYFISIGLVFIGSRIHRRSRNV